MQTQADSKVKYKLVTFVKYEEGAWSLVVSLPSGTGVALAVAADVVGGVVRAVGGQRMRLQEEDHLPAASRRSARLRRQKIVPHRSLIQSNLQSGVKTSFEIC
ncbi:unnamed protein product, partial [Brenthis ino]